MSYRQSTSDKPGSIVARGSGSQQPVARGSPAGRSKRPLSGAAPRGPRTSDAGTLLRWSTEDSPGLKIGPTVVLIISLLFIAFVVILHIWGKLTRA